MICILFIVKYFSALLIVRTKPNEAKKKKYEEQKNIHSQSFKSKPDELSEVTYIHNIPK